MALEKNAGRSQASGKADQGVSDSETGEERIKRQVRQLVSRFARLAGRRPRILVATTDEDSQNHSQKMIASAFADLGFDVDIAPSSNSPGETARHAVENDVHLIGLSSLATEHLKHISQLRVELEKLDREDIMIIAAGEIPSQEHAAFIQAGATSVFESGMVISDEAAKIVLKLADHLGYSLDDSTI